MWNAQSLRFTAFATQQTVQVNPEKWWERVTNASEPLRIEYRPRTQQVVIEGIHNEGRLVLEILSERLDWKWIALDQQDEMSEETALSSLGVYSEKTNEFMDLLDRWLLSDDVPTSSRIAFGAVLLFPVPNRRSGYETLQHYLPDVKLTIDNSSDFLYQINRFRDLDINGHLIRINRLMKWSVTALQHHRIAISANNEIRHLGAAPAIAARLELDINTAPSNYHEFGATMQRTILKQFVELAHEIVEHGDIP